MADTVREIGIKQHDGNYQTKDVGVSYANVEGLSTEATAFKALSADKATTDKNNKDITTYIASISKNGSKIRTTNGAGDNLDVGFTMTGASSSIDGVGGFVPTPTKGNQNKFLKGDGTWAIPQDTTYTGSSNIDISSSNVIDLKNTTVTANTYGPTADVTGSNGATIKIPKFTVDAKGRLTSAGTQTFTAVNTTYSAGTGLSLSGTTFSLGSHASGGTGYGIGTGSNYGHVKLSDTYASKVSGGAAANGLAASQNALYNAYNTLNTNFSSALTDLKATAIAQAVGATGTTFTSVIATLGTIVDQGKKTQTLSAGTTSYTISAGYHNGQGSVSVTKGTAKVGTEDRTWSNNGTVSLNCGQSLSVGAGVYYTGTITANSLASQTTVDSGKTAVTAATMLTGYQGWVNGSKITGTMPYHDGQNIVLDTSTTSYTIPAGYHNRNGEVSISTQEKSITASRSDQTVTPDTGKVLSKVTVAKYPDANGTYGTITSNGTHDMGTTNNYRHVSVNVPQYIRTCSLVVPTSNTAYSQTIAVLRFVTNQNSCYVEAIGNANGTTSAYVQAWFGKVYTQVYSGSMAMVISFETTCKYNGSTVTSGTVRGFTPWTGAVIEPI